MPKGTILTRICLITNNYINTTNLHDHRNCPAMVQGECYVTKFVCFVESRYGAINPKRLSDKCEDS